MEDSAIIELYWKRSEAAISATAEKYGKYCYSIAYNILSDLQDAEEAVNDTYMDAWNCIPPHRPAALAAFLGKMTRRRSIDKWRSRSAEKRGGGEAVLVLDELGDIPLSSGDVQSEIEAEELATAINRFVRSLSELQRSVFIRRYWYLQPVHTIAQSLGFSDGKVKTMLYRQRKRLMSCLNKEGLL